MEKQQLVQLIQVEECIEEMITSSAMNLHG